MVSVHRHSGLSFRTCEGGRLFSQSYNDDTINLDVTSDGLIFSAIINKQRYEAKLSAKLLNNVWYNINLFFRLGNLTLTAAGHTQVFIYNFIDLFIHVLIVKIIKIIFISFVYIYFIVF